MSKFADRLQRLSGGSVPLENVRVPVPVPVPVPDSASPIERGARASPPENGEQSAYGHGHGHAYGEKSDERGARILELRAQMARIGEKLQRGRGSLRDVGEPDSSEYQGEFAPAVGGGLPGELSEGADGPLRCVRTDYDEDHCHGSIPVCSALAATAKDVALLALDPSLSEIDWARALYIDTETTGLAGGAGTIPFLIGMAWFEGRRLCVEQLLLERPGLETPMLQRLAQRLSDSSAVVSFNGKSFDWPLLRTRFVLARVAAPRLPAHLDLLHCARRVYKRRLGSVRLIHLEQALLGLTRVDDIPGELIPQTYLGFVRGQVHGSALAPIVEHNRNDLIALAALLGEITRRFRGEQPAQDARDQLGFAGVASRGQDCARALTFAQGAAEADLRGDLAPEAHYLSGELCLRADNFADAERAFLLSVEAACDQADKAARAHLALSKLYEHRFKRYTDALEHAQLAALCEGAEASRRRVSRLARKRRASALSLFEVSG